MPCRAVGDSTAQCSVWCARVTHSSLRLQTEHIPCDGSPIEIINAHHTVQGEWGLYCDKAWQAEALDPLFFLGFGIGASGFGSVADQIGRRRTWLYSGIMTSVTSFLCAASPDYVVYLLARILVGVGTGGFGIVTYVLAQEIIGVSWAGFAGVNQAVLFSLANVFLAPTAYAFPGWRVLTVLTALSPWCFLAFYKIIPESPRWLLSQGDTAAANGAETARRG